MSRTIELWEQLHRERKHRLHYPSEHVARWVASLDDRDQPLDEPLALDIGCGHGRHMKVFANAGINAQGIDVAADGPAPFVRRGDMRWLPFPGDWFDFALAYGVFYYGTWDDHQMAVSELYRVLREGGEALVVTRTMRDSRKILGERVGSRKTVRVRGGDEEGMLMNFLAEEDIPLVYAAFTHVNWERTETTRLHGTWLDSDWLIRVQK